MFYEKKKNIIRNLIYFKIIFLIFIIDPKLTRLIEDLIKLNMNKLLWPIIVMTIKNGFINIIFKKKKKNHIWLLYILVYIFINSILWLLIKASSKK